MRKVSIGPYKSLSKWIIEQVPGQTRGILYLKPFSNPDFFLEWNTNDNTNITISGKQIMNVYQFWNFQYIGNGKYTIINIGLKQEIKALLSTTIYDIFYSNITTFPKCYSGIECKCNECDNICSSLSDCKGWSSWYIQEDTYKLKIAIYRRVIGRTLISSTTKQICYLNQGINKIPNNKYVQNDYSGDLAKKYSKKDTIYDCLSSSQKKNISVIQSLDITTDTDEIEHNKWILMT